jgi:hypothetical protein
MLRLFLLMAVFALSATSTASAGKPVYVGGAVPAERRVSMDRYDHAAWNALQLVVGGKGISLEDIEHQVLRKMGEPRIHFAIVCASRSCPRLLNRAYTAADLEKQLTANTQAFFASEANFRYVIANGVTNGNGGGKMQFSAILKWFAEDFGPDQAAQLKTVAPYLPSKAAWQAANAGRVRVSYLNYDWSLNDQATAPR